MRNCGVSILFVLGALLGSFWFQTEEAHAAPNYEINYQGKLTDGSNIAVPDGTYNMRFWLLTSPSIATTSAIWTESLTGTNRVQVTNGLFSVMLGSTSALTSVDFNQTLYLGVEIGSTTTSPNWDGEMSPRKILGAVPAAFEADKVDGLDGDQFVRNDEPDSMASTSESTLFTLYQGGTGDSFDVYDGLNQVFSIIDGGFVGIGTGTPSAMLSIQGTSTSDLFNLFTSSGIETMTVLSDGKVGIGTTTPFVDLTVAGDFALTGGLYDSGLTRGSNGQILQTTGSEIHWVATDTLGFIASSSDAVTPDMVLSSGQSDGYCLAYQQSGDTWQWYNCVGAASLFTDSGNITYLTSLTDHLSVGTTSALGLFTVATSSATTTASFAQYGAGDVLNLFSSGSEIFTVLSNGNVGIGSTSPSRALTVAGGAILDGTNITFASSSASTLTINYAAPATSTIQDSQAFAWTIATGTGAEPILRIDTSGTAKATTSINGGFVVDSGAIQYSSASGITSIDNLQLGNLSFDTDAGVVQWIDLPVATTSTGDIESYSALLDGNPLLTVYGTTDGSGGVTNTGVGIGTTSPASKLDVWGDFRVGTSSTPTLFVNVSTNRVGIGSTSPSRALTVAGDAIVANLYATGTATTTNLAIGGDLFSDLTGTGLTVVGNALTASIGSSSLSVGGSYTSNYILMASTTVTGGWAWVATSSLGVSSGATTLAGLTDTDTSGVASGTVLVYNAGTGNWESKATSTLGIPNATGPTLVVAASDSLDTSRADYVADGTHDEVEIQEAIDALPSTGGTIQLLEGTYNVGTTTYTDRSINMATDTALVGEGPSTVIKLQNSFNHNINVIEADNVDSVAISSLQLNGNTANNTSAAYNGIYFTNVGSSTIENVHVKNVEDFAINFDSSSDNRITNNLLTDNGTYGIQLDNTSSRNAIVGNTIERNGSYGVNVTNNSNDNAFSGNLVEGNTTGGFIMDTTARDVFSSNKVYNNGTYGFQVISSANNNTFTGNDISYQSYGLFLVSAVRNTITGNQITNSPLGGVHLGPSLGAGSHNTTISGNNFYNNGGGANSSIYIETTDDTIISGNNIVATGSVALIEINDSASDRTYIASNVYSNSDTTTYISDSGTNTRYTDQSRITLTTNTEKAFSIFDISASSSSSTAEIQQLGSGDILDLYNASSRVLTVDNSGNVGIGTSSPSALFAVAGDTILDGTNITFASSSASTLTINYAAPATSTIQDSQAFAWTIATGTGAEPILRIDTSGTAKATTSINGGFVVDSGAIQYSSASGITSIDNLQLGALNFEDNAGVVSWVDLPVTTATSGLVESYTAQVDGNSLLTLYGLTDGGGGVKNLGIAVATATPSALLTLWDASSTQSNTLFNIVDTSSSTLFSVLDSGNVGIGTTSPSRLLTVAGKIYGTGIEVTSATTTNLIVGSDNISDLTGVGIVNSNGSLSVSSSSLNIALSGLTDTDTSAAASGTVLVYDAGLSKWVSRSTSSLNITGSGDGNIVGPTLVVAASDSLDTSRADYVADGTNDQDTINTALAALPSSGGTVQLLEGAYAINNSIDITQSSTTLVGEGPSTILNITATSTSWPVISASSIGNIHISDLAIDGGAATAGNQDGIAWSGVSSSTIQNVVSNNFRRYGISLASNSNYNNIINNTANNGLSNGVNVAGSKGNHIIGNTTNNNGLYGLSLSSSNENILSGNESSHNTWYGIALSSATDNSITGNITNNQDHIGIYGFSNSHRNTVTGNIVDNNLGYGIRFDSSNENIINANKLYDNGGGAGASIYLSGADDTLIASNNITATGSAALINISNSTSDRTYVAANVYHASSTTYISDSGTNTRYTDQSRITLTTNTEKAFSIFDISASSSSSTAEIQQLGSGDILNLYNNTSQVLTVSNGGFLGLGTTTPTANLSISGTGGQTSPLFRVSSSTNDVLFEIAADGSVNIGSGAINYDVATNQTSIERLALGNVEFETDAGAVSWVDMQASGTPSGTILSYTAQLDANPLLTIYGESDGSGGVQNTRVGVGSTSPQARLSVEAGSGDTNPLFQIGSSTDQTYLSVDYTGNVGIGTTSPASPLDVNGGLTIEGEAGCHPGWVNDAFNIDVCSGVVRMQHWGTDAASVPIALNPSGGYVGVGSSTPTATLTVQGIDGQTANLLAIASSTGSQYLSLSATGTLTFGGDKFIDLTGSGLAVSGGALTASITPAVLNSSNSGSNSQCLTYQDSNFKWATCGSGSSPFTTSGSVTYLTDTTHHLSVGTTTALGVFTVSTTSATTSASFAQYGSGDILNLSSGGSEVFTVDNSGNVGIGTSSPASKLDVWGNLRVGTSSAPVFYVNTATNRVGLGTANPSYPFQVGSNPLTGVAVDSSANVLAGGFLFNDDSNTGLDNPAADTLGLYTGGTARLIVSSTGYIGIGSTTPTAKLSVQGDAGQTANLFAVASSSNDTLFAILSDGSVDINSGAFNYDVASNKTSIERLDLGPVKFEDSAGWVSWIDVAASTSATAGDPLAYSAQIDSQDILTLYSEQDGSGGIGKVRVVVGTSSASLYSSSNIPGGSFIVSDGIICVDDGGDNCDDAPRGRGGLFATSTTVTAIDLAENYPTKDADLSAGELAMLDPENPVFVKTYDRFASSTREDSFIGVVSTKPGVLLGGWGSDKYAGELEVPITLSGRVPVKVNLEGGDIYPGDRITFSSVPGIGMRATTTGMTAGVALEPFVATSTSASTTEGTIVMFVNSEYHAPQSQFSIDGNGNVAFGTSTDPNYKLKVGGDIAATGFINISASSSKRDINFLTDEEKQGLIEDLRGIDIATYNYKTEASSSPKRLGLIADQAPSSVLSVNGKGVDLYKLSALTLNGVQDVDKRVTGIEDQLGELLNSPSATSTGPSLLDRLKTLARNFIDGMLTVAGLKTDELCVGDVCVDQATFLKMVNSAGGTPHAPTTNAGGTENSGEGNTGSGTTTNTGTSSTTNSGTGTGTSTNTGTSTSTPSQTSGGGSGGGAGSSTPNQSQGDTSGQAEPAPAPDTEAPVITLLGDDPMELTVGDSYNEPGAAAEDTVDGDLSSSITISGSVDTSTAGDYTVTYSVSDASGNEGTASRTVTVTAPTEPPAPLSTGTSTSST